CVSCLEMEKFTFSDPAVAERMGRMLLLQADVTRMTDEDRALLARFDLFGPPGILFFDAQGRLIPGARVVGFQKADAFRKVQDRVLAGRWAGPAPFGFGRPVRRWVRPCGSVRGPNRLRPGLRPACAFPGRRRPGCRFRTAGTAARPAGSG